MTRCTFLSLLLIAAACSGGKDDLGAGDPDAAADAPDLDAAADAPGDQRSAPLINEFMRKPPANPDTGLEDTEFVEIAGDPDTDYSDYWLLQVRGNGDTSQLGTVRTAQQLGVTNAGGYWATGYLVDTYKNNTYTLLLVQNYSEADTEDFDLDTDNDGMINVAPWDDLSDSLAYQDDGSAGPTDLEYSTVVLLPGADGIAAEWEGASRVPDHVDTDTPADWVRNDPDGAGLPGFEDVIPEPGEAISTMGGPNRTAQAVR